MSKRNLVADLLFHVAVVVFAVWLGGQVFNATMIVPAWSAKLPESVIAITTLREFNTSGIPFFVVFNPLWVTLLMAASLLLGRGMSRARRRWMLAFTLCAAAAAAAVIGWMAPTVGRNLHAIREGQFSPEIADALNLWVKLNWARLALELCGFLCAMRALSSPVAARAGAGFAPASVGATREAGSSVVLESA